MHNLGGFKVTERKLLYSAFEWTMEASIVEAVTVVSQERTKQVLGIHCR